MELITLFHRLNDAFWDEKYWLPANMTWRDVSPPSNDTFNYTSSTDLLLAIPLAVVLLAVRYFLDCYCFRPLGLYLGIQSKAHKEIPPIPVLETAYVSNGEVKYEQIVCLSKQLDWTERQIQRWLRLRRARDKPTTLTRFTESCWRFVYYSGSVVFAGFCVWDKPWAWDTRLLFENPPHPITTGCWWYCMVTCAFYWSLLISQSFDVKRKDFVEMMIHHIVSIATVSMSWVLNTHRGMIMGLFLHDSSDVFLELAKLSKYAQFTRLSTVVFTLMVVVWIGTRLVWYPYCIVSAGLFGSVVQFQRTIMYITVNFLFLSILVLNIFWTYFILITFYKALVYGSEKIVDPRSCSEDEDVETFEASKQRKNK